MPATLLHYLLAAAAAGALPPARADPPPSCELPASGENVLGDRAGQLERYERLPQSCLREIFSACSQASSRTLLDFASAAACSFGYEALLKKGFGGNFHALIAWWQSQKDAASP